MSLAAAHRARAAEERQNAAKTDLSNRRDMHLRSAEMWDEMAAAAEDTDRLTVANAVAKQAGASR